MTQDQVRKLFRYDRRGFLTWRVKPCSRILAGSRAGGRKAVYVVIRYGQVDYYAHRLIFLYHRGWMPEQVDHRDRNKKNDRIGNLRPSGPSHNGTNRGPTRRSKTGFKGVYQRGRRYVAMKTLNGVQSYVGTFDSAPQAAKARGL